MAIEDHPQFADWKAALAELERAWDEYTTEKAFTPGLDHSEKEASLRAAMRRFHEISEKIDA